MRNEVMIGNRRLAVVLAVLVAGAVARAQGPCPTGVASDKLVCVIPQVYGTSGLVLSASAPGELDFANSSLKPVNAAIVSQATMLPIASPSSGLSFAWDPAAKVFAPYTASLGPILGERARTIGRYKFYVGLDYQFFHFNSFDGTSLKSLPVVFTQPDNSTTIGTLCSLHPPDGPNSVGACSFIRDVVRTNNRLDLKVHQFITLVTFGITNNIDVSAVIPVQNVRMAMFSDATIVNNSNSPFHFFDTRSGCGSATTNCLNQQFFNSGTASGIGDITLRVKGTAWTGEHAGMAVGADIRVPTGDSLNYLGAGAAGVRPFLVWARSSTITPHVVVGYQVNGSSVVAGDLTTGSKERLPGSLTYAVGADASITKKLTAAVDLIGQQVFQAPRLTKTMIAEPGACTQDYPNCAAPFLKPNQDPALQATTGSFNVSSLSMGWKYSPFGDLLLSGNVLIKVNKSGLRSRPVPLVGVSYTF